MRHTQQEMAMWWARGHLCPSTPANEIKSPVLLYWWHGMSPSTMGKHKPYHTHLTSPPTEMLFFFSYNSFVSKVSISIASDHQLLYHWVIGSQQKQKCRKIYVIYHRKSKGMLAIYRKCSSRGNKSEYPDNGIANSCCFMTSLSICCCP